MEEISKLFILAIKIIIQVTIFSCSENGHDSTPINNILTVQLVQDSIFPGTISLEYNQIENQENLLDHFSFLRGTMDTQRFSFNDFESETLVRQMNELYKTRDDYIKDHSRINQILDRYTLLIVGNDTFYQNSDMLYRKEELSGQIKEDINNSLWVEATSRLNRSDISTDTSLATFYNIKHYENPTVVNAADYIPIDIIPSSADLNYWKNKDTLYFEVDTNFISTEVKVFSDALKKALGDWKIYTSIDFIDVSSNTANSSKPDIKFTFLGKQIPVPSCDDLFGVFAAAEIGPGSGNMTRIVSVFSPFFKNHDFSKEGILRHEVGHILGFRHTCLYWDTPDSIRCDEDRQYIFWGALGSYDESSVMKTLKEACFYNDYDLIISAKDALMIRKLYR